MPCFLKAPASMATNNGDCRSETAGTATLMIFTGVSAGDVGFDCDTKKVTRKIRTVDRCIIAPLAASFTPDYSKREKMSRSGALWRRAYRVWFVCFNYSHKLS